MSERLFIAARAPRPGFTKTRLGHAIGHDAAARVYRAFLTDLGARFGSAPFDVGWYVTPPAAWPEIRPCLPGHISTTIVLPQPEGDWAARQRTLFAGMAARGERRTVLIASDSPHLPVSIVANAFDLLRERDLVLGPVLDGGYYLIGMRSPHVASVLDNVQMSTGDVLEQLIDRAAELGFTTGLVEPTFDVDVVDDLARLRDVVQRHDDLPATHAALHTLGLLRERAVVDLVAVGSEVAK